MKFPYIVNDLADVLVDFYVNYRQLHVDERKFAVMKLHMKQALAETYKYLYSDTEEEIWSIGIVKSYNIIPYELNHDAPYDMQFPRIIESIRSDLHMIIPSLGHMVNTDRDVIILNCVPFDGVSLSTNDITDLLDLDNT